MDKERLWKRFQAHMGYTDAEMEIFRSDPLKVKMVTETPEFVKSRIIAEVIESHGCHAGHKVAQKFVMDGNGHSDPKNERRRGAQRPPEPSSLNDLIRPHQQRLWDRQAERLRGLQVDHEIELRRLLEG